MKFYKNTNATYIAGVLIGMVCIYVVFSVILAKIMSCLYRDVMPDVTLVSKDANLYRNSYVRSYLVSNIKHSKLPVMLILGSSFSYGYSIPAKTTYGVIFKRFFPDYKVLNASIIGGGVARTIHSLMIMQEEKLKVDTLILELNLSNVISDLKIGQNNSINYYLQYFAGAKTLDKTMPYLTIFLAKPLGFEAIKLMDLNRIANMNPEVFNECNFNWDNLPDSYFENYKVVSQLIEQHEKQLMYMFSLAQQVADRVYFFISPIDYTAVQARSQFKVRDLQKDIVLINRLCQKSGVKIYCLKAKYFKEENYCNLTHFNQLGHENLALWLSGQLKVKRAGGSHA